MSEKERVLHRLRELGISYELTEHIAVFTIEEMAATGIESMGEICKNLFLRDAKGRSHFLVLIPGHKQADLAMIGEKLGSGKLSFASEERLMRYLGLTRGAVTPFGLINDEALAVTVVLDAQLASRTRLGFHPNVNTATVFLSYADLMRFFADCGNPVVILDM
ncbi:MAG TPA: prolyl-tRNA synthetase associated domain-containing protein [Candidatus Acidoferrum sp.]|nr:prolyl-tRNA synthetase associated domain-containing protein [Candidatus Acidoferrum sp.]